MGIKRTILGVAVVVGILLFLSRFYFPPVLIFYKIDENDLKSAYHQSPDAFVKEMEFLKAHQYNVVPLSDLLSVRESHVHFPEKSVAIVLYGGMEGNFVHAFPILKELGLSATYFIRPSDLGKNGFLNVEDLSILVDNQMDIGLLADTKEEYDLRQLVMNATSENHVRLIAGYEKWYKGDFSEFIKSGFDGGILMSSESVSGIPEAFRLPVVMVRQTSQNLVVFWWKLSGFDHLIRHASGS